MSPTVIVGLLVFYLIGVPILTRLIFWAYRKYWVIDRINKKGAKNRSTELPEDKWKTVSSSYRFTMKDVRPLSLGRKKKKKDEDTNDAPKGGIQNRVLFFVLWGIGLLFAVAPAFTGSWLLLPVAVLMFWTNLAFSVRSAKNVLQTRNDVMRRMYEIGVSCGLIDTSAYPNPKAGAVSVLEWRDYIEPVDVEYQVQTKYNASGQENFMQQFNQVYGTENTWVPKYDKDAGANGWDYERGKLSIKANLPLPRRADWSEHYVLHPAIAWSFFSIGLGIENGVELPNAEGKIEHVLGFDLSGEQAKVGEKNGVKVANAIVTSPMVFIGGGTGGGKAQALDTKIYVYRKHKEK